MRTKFCLIPALLCILVSSINCTQGNNSPNQNSSDGGDSSNRSEVDFWLTKADKSVLLARQKNTLSFTSTSSNDTVDIDVDSSQSFQAVDGFGYTLTGGSAQLINGMEAAARTSLLEQIFEKNENSISVSYLRISIGASDLSAAVFSYDDLPAGQTDVNLDKFTLSEDTVHLIPLLKEILQVNPAIKILGSPWSPPVWMKDNGNSKGGSLKPEYYSAYAKYFVKYIQAMKARGITIDAITPQNEPLNPANNPSMYMTASQQADFIKNHLGPAFQAAGIATKIIVYDHNCNKPEYPMEILNDAGAKAFVDGSAFHLYEGDISALSQVHTAHPDRNVYFTEQWTGSNGTFDGDLQWHIKNVIIGSMRNWSRIALEWNLANDSTYGPHTPGGCTECKGAFTITGSAASPNVAYYIIAHASKFVTPGSVRIYSTSPDNLFNVAFKRPDGRKVLIVLNETADSQNFNIKYNGKRIAPTLPAKSVGTFVW